MNDVNCTNGRTLGNDTEDAFYDLLTSSNDVSNPNLRDVFFPSTGTACDPNDVDLADPSSYYFKVNVNGQCFENTHPDNYDVYDFTPWVARHPGGADKIVAFADGQDRTFYLTFPGSHHDMSRWRKGKEHLLYLGRENDVTTLKSLPSALIREDIAQEFGSNVGAVVATGKIMVCGSPFEVATMHDENSAPLHQGTVNTAWNSPCLLFLLLTQSSLSCNFRRLWNAHKVRYDVMFELSISNFSIPASYPKTNLAQVQLYPVGNERAAKINLC